MSQVSRRSHGLESDQFDLGLKSEATLCPVSQSYARFHIAKLNPRNKRYGIFTLKIQSQWLGGTIALNVVFGSSTTAVSSLWRNPTALAKCRLQLLTLAL